METTRHKHQLIIIGLMALTAVGLALLPEPTVSDKMSVRLELPGKVGDYEGVDKLYCQNELCSMEFVASELCQTNVCPACGGKLDTVTLAERRSLPADTIILKKQYVALDGQNVSVLIVVSGREQKSIHRPQQCLPALGHVIERAGTIPVSIDDRSPLKVMLLDLRKTGETLEGMPYEHLSSYAYWFVGTDRETPYHLERLFWMSMDRVFRSVAHRWAYIAVATERRKGSDEHISRLQEFIRDLYPLIKE